MPAQNEFPDVFEQLKNIFKPYAKNLTITADTSDSYSLDGPYSEEWKKELFFGSAQVKKNYVSFYLMPVYMYPELLKDISPELKSECRESPVSTLRRSNLHYLQNWLRSRAKVLKNSNRRINDERTRDNFRRG